MMRCVLSKKKKIVYIYLTTLSFESSIIVILACARWDGRDQEFLVSAHYSWITYSVDGSDPKCSEVLGFEIGVYMYRTLHIDMQIRYVAVHSKQMIGAP